MRTFRSTLLVVAILASEPAIAAAGECVDRPEDYVATFEAGPSAEGFDYAVECLSSNQVVEGRLWAGPIAAAGFARMRADTLRPRIARAVSALLRTSWAKDRGRRRLLYEVAARRGIASIDSVDVFTQLVPPMAPLDFETYEPLAILADCRAVGVLEERYHSLRGGAPMRYPDEILDVLSCLYHIPCKQAVVAARRMRSSERDPRMRERLRRIIERR
jgi:hypothetical protein